MRDSRTGKVRCALRTGGKKEDLEWAVRVV